MTETTGMLRAELLSVYRDLAMYHRREKRLNKEIVQLKRDLEYEARCTKSAEEQLATTRLVYRECEDHNMHLVEQNMRYEIAADACLDLIGAVIEEDAAGDRMHAAIMAAIAESAKPEPTSPLQKALAEFVSKPVKERPEVRFEMLGDSDGKPFNCLSCGGYKDPGMTFFCEECWELEQDREWELYYELSQAWRDGARDFPRPGKNAKLL